MLSKSLWSSNQSKNYEVVSPSSVLQQTSLTDYWYQLLYIFNSFSWWTWVLHVYITGYKYWLQLFTSNKSSFLFLFWLFYGDFFPHWMKCCALVLSKYHRGKVMVGGGLWQSRPGFAVFLSPVCGLVSARKALCFKVRERFLFQLAKHVPCWKLTSTFSLLNRSDHNFPPNCENLRTKWLNIDIEKYSLWLEKEQKYMKYKVT